jgi:mannose/fructose-specific phosphotransferase system component IIA
MIGVVICHGSLAFEMVEAAFRILGHKDDLYPFSNEKFTTEEVVQQITELIESKGKPQEVVFMVDLRGGNCWTIARLLAHSHPGYYVLSGVNMPMIFSFSTKKDKMDIAKLAEAMKTDAFRGIVLEQ